MAKRAANCTTYEKETLITFVQEYSNIFEDKKTDSRSNKEKDRAWADITTKFNSEANVSKKTIKQLQSCWKNIKIRAKKAATLNRQERFRTGGGPRPRSPTAEDSYVQGILQDKYDPLHNEYDDDFVSAENGMGCGLINVTSMVAVKDYFGDNAKLAMSIVSIGSGIGGVSFQQASAFGIQTFGWRGAMFMLAGMMLNVMIPAFAMPPVPKDQKVPTHDTRNTWKIPPILTSVAFDLWLLFVFTISMCVSMMLIIFPHYLTIKGFSSYDATTFLSLSIIMGFPGRVILIFLMKFCRIPTSVYIFLTGLSISVSILILVYMNTTATVLLSTLVSGTGFGFWIILLWAGTLDISGSELYASAQSLVIFTFGVATFLSGPFAGFILEQTETYDIAYLASAGGLLGASVLYLLVPATNYCKQRGSRYERL